MRTIEAIEDLITGIIFRKIHKCGIERDIAKEIIKALTEENNLNIPPVVGRSEQLAHCTEDGHTAKRFFGGLKHCDVCNYPLR